MDLDILKIASDTKNMKKLENFTHSALKKNPMCGDYIKLKINLKKNIIKDVGYETKSCIYCQASASLLSKISINSKKDEIVKLCDDAKLFFYKDKKKFNDNLKLFSNLFIEENLARKDCILLPFKALKKIVSN